MLLTQYGFTVLPNWLLGCSIAALIGPDTSSCAKQVGLLRSKFDEALGEKARQLVDVSTIDGFQARFHALHRPSQDPAHCANCCSCYHVPPHLLL